jgi:hypothetical protein
MALTALQIPEAVVVVEDLVQMAAAAPAAAVLSLSELTNKVKHER